MPVLSMTVSLAGCGTDSAYRDAVVGKTVAEQTGAALAVADREREVGRELPDYPAECRRTWRSGVRVGDRLDAAALKADVALGNANAQITACARWYDKVRDGFMKVQGAAD